MKKITMTLTMLLVAWLMMPNTASAKTELSPSLSVAWGGDNVTVDGWSATFTDDWQGAASLWLKTWDSETSSSVPADYSAYDYFVVEFTEPLNAGVRLTLEDGSWGTNTTYGQADAGATMVSVNLANASIDLTNVEQAYFQNTSANLAFTIKSVWLGTADDMASFPSELTLQGWSKWNDAITLTNGDDGLNINFGTTAAWSGAAKWLDIDASDYEYLVFELAPGTENAEVQAFIAYGEGSWQNEQVTVKTSETSTYVKFKLDADRKSSVKQVGFQNKDNSGANFTVTAAYWVRKAAYADLTNWWVQASDGVPEEDRVVFANFPDFDYMVFEFSEATKQELKLQANYGGNISADPWWIQSSTDDAIQTSRNLLTAFVPLPDADFTSVYYIGPTVQAKDGGSVTLWPSRIYCATKEYLTETMEYTEEQLADHIYSITPAPDYLDLPIAAINPSDDITVNDDEVVITCPAGDEWDEPSAETRTHGWFLYDTGSSNPNVELIKQMLQWLPEFDYVVIDFSRPTSAPMELYPMLYDATWTVAAEQSILVDPFCEHYFIPLPEVEGDMAAAAVWLSLQPYSITHVGRVYLAKKSYLTDTMGYTDDELANSIFFGGETVTVGSTGYATYYFDEVNDHYVPGGIQGFDYVFDKDTEALNVAYTFEPDVLMKGDMAVVLKAVDGITLPHTFYFPKAYSEGRGECADTEPCLFGTIESEMTYNQTSYDNVFYYKLSTLNGENVGFYWGAEDGGPFMNGAKKAYLILPDMDNYTAAAGYHFDSNMNLVREGAVTAITDITTEAGSTTPAYNLAGQRVDKSFRGIVIQNGKKIIK